MSGLPLCSVERIHLPSRSRGFHRWVRKIPWRSKWQPIPVFLPAESYGQRSLAGYSPWGHEESDTTGPIKQVNLTPTAAVPLAKDTKASTVKGSTGAQPQPDGWCSVSGRRLATAWSWLEKITTGHQGSSSQQAPASTILCSQLPIQGHQTLFSRNCHS